MKISIYLDSLIALSALVFAYVTFRVSILQIRNSLLASLEEELSLIGQWFGKSYSEEASHDRSWFWPLNHVVTLEYAVALRSILSNSSSILVGKKLIVDLTTLNQGLARFNQNVNKATSFVTANPGKTIEACEEIENDYHKLNLSYEQLIHNIAESKLKGKPYSKDSANYLQYIYRLNKNIHVDGIGSPGYYDSHKRFPTPHQSYLVALGEAKCQKNKGIWIWYNWKWFISDLLVIIVVCLSLSFIIFSQ